MASPARARAFRRDLLLAQARSRTAVSPDRAAATASVWKHCWLPFLADLRIKDPFLSGITDKVQVLRVFAERVRDGRLSRSRKRVSGVHVRDEIFHISKTFTDLGAPDPRLTVHGTIDPRLTRLYSAYIKADPPPTRVKPLPMQILLHAHNRALTAMPQDPVTNYSLNLAWLAAFYLLRPGEYCHARNNSPLRVENISLLVGSQPLDVLNCPLHLLAAATHSSITFDIQKNRQKGEVIGHGTSGHPFACPTRSLARIILHLRTMGADPQTPLCAYRPPNTQQPWRFIVSSNITRIVQASAAALPHVGFSPQAVTARSMRAGGAMALLCAGIDTDIIKLVGRWRSDAMFRYLHAQALPIVANLASKMFQHGSFTLLPGQTLPQQAYEILNDADTASVLSDAV